MESTSNLGRAKIRKEIINWCHNTWKMRRKVTTMGPINKVSPFDILKETTCRFRFVFQENCRHNFLLPR